MKVVEVRQGSGPVILAFPHVGMEFPDIIFERLNGQGRLLADTDWHVDRLYDGLLEGATRVRAGFHRYVIDANRDPTGRSLYPGRPSTGLVPLTDFDNRPIWRSGMEPSSTDIATRLETFHQAYHRALHREIERVYRMHGIVVLFDCHSIRSEIPFLFEGRLPDFNIGDNDGATCDPAFTSAVCEICAGAPGFSHVANGRFKGGWTTRHYGRPKENIHAIQMELAQATHLETEAPPFAYSAQKAVRLRVHLAEILEKLQSIALKRDGGRPA